MDCVAFDPSKDNKPRFQYPIKRDWTKLFKNLIKCITLLRWQSVAGNRKSQAVFTRLKGY